MNLPSIAPHDCALLIGIPLSSREFLEDLDRPSQEYARLLLKDYVGATRAAAAMQYERFVAAPARAILEGLEKWGVTVVRRAGLAAVAPAFQAHAVIGLLAHAHRLPLVPSGAFTGQEPWMSLPCFELRDGPMSLADLAEAIPESWHGFSDLMACAVSDYARVLKQRHPGCTFLTNSQPTTPIFRLRLFDATVALLLHQAQPYGSAILAATRAAAELHASL